MKRSRILALGLLLAGAGAWAKFDERQLAARFYFDLGPDSVDVAAYPPVQRANYQVFARTCSKCHTLARPINAPLTSKTDWKRFLARMHVITKNAPEAKFTPIQAKAILDFLTYDSKIRKIDRKADFEARAEFLKKDFERAKAESARLQGERDARGARQYDDHAGATPRPR